MKCFELVNDEKVEYCTIVKDQKVEFYEFTHFSPMLHFYTP